MRSATWYRTLGLLLLFVLVALPLMADPSDDYREVIRTIRCDCGCHPQSVEDCACGRADQMRQTIAGLVEGRDGQQAMSAKAVIAQYVAEQGEQIRISPAATGFNLVAWLGPLIALVLGLAGAVSLVRHLARRADTAVAGGPVETVPPVDLDDPYRAKLRKQLEEWD